MFEERILGFPDEQQYPACKGELVDSVLMDLGMLHTTRNLSEPRQPYRLEFNILRHCVRPSDMHSSLDRVSKRILRTKRQRWPLFRLHLPANNEPSIQKVKNEF